MLTEQEKIGIQTGCIPHLTYMYTQKF